MIASSAPQPRTPDLMQQTVRSSPFEYEVTSETSERVFVVGKTEAIATLVVISGQKSQQAEIPSESPVEVQGFKIVVGEDADLPGEPLPLA